MIPAAFGYTRAQSIEDAIAAGLEDADVHLSYAETLMTTALGPFAGIFEPSELCQSFRAGTMEVGRRVDCDRPIVVLDRPFEIAGVKAKASPVLNRSRIVVIGSRDQRFVHRLDRRQHRVPHADLPCGFEPPIRRIELRPRRSAVGRR